MGEEKRLEYIKATIFTTTQGAEALSAVLPALGIPGFSVEDPADLDFIMASKDALIWDYIDVPPQKGQGNASEGEVRVAFWLEKGSEPEIQELRIALMKLKSDEQYGVYGDGADFGRLWLDTEAVCDDWKDRYKESFRSFSPCGGILIVPPWEPAARDIDRGGTEGELKIVIDPGMAFGTGSHETTAMCLSKLKALLKPGDIMLDAGTGSGILAIAAALLGAAHVYAVEIDADAAGSAAGNIKINEVQEKISLIVGDVAEEGVLPSHTRYDLIAANLTCSLLEKLLAMLKGALKDEGTILLSGLLDAQEDRIRETLENEGMRPVLVEKSGEWLMVEVRK